MSRIIGLKFREYGQVYYFDSGAFVVNKNDLVIVNTDQGLGLGEVVLFTDEVPEELNLEDIKPIYRLANDEDIVAHRENTEVAEEAFRYCRLLVRQHELEMKLVDVEVYHDRGKMVFYFTAPNRIDFRELVKDLVKKYRTRIELRQIGVRHETQMIGAVGNCGQMCCCRRFMRKFAPVTIKMAKEQNLFLNPTKISGICGRLLCCLSFEQESYESFHRHCPKIGKKINTSLGMVKVLRTNLFRESISLLTETGEEQEVSLTEWKEMAAKPSKRSGTDGIEANDTKQDEPRIRLKTPEPTPELPKSQDVKDAKDTKEAKDTPPKGKREKDKRRAAAPPRPPREGGKKTPPKPRRKRKRKFKPTKPKPSDG
ncbi:PSP1 domain-containing protein [Desulfovibrio inopinatus]|uniref:PSP1 domain-containing protein n=1 Tax=Desulfovibrio inopinatus TaxID=102109 RepID=UPI00041AB6C5|nr:regulatory iron-sulfur-containing complex subunit RicT [Desulfovibrio inopinatus]